MMKPVGEMAAEIPFLAHVHTRAERAREDLARMLGEDCPRCEAPGGELARRCRNFGCADTESTPDGQPLCKHADGAARHRTDVDQTRTRRRRLLDAGVTNEHILALVPPSRIDRVPLPNASDVGEANREGVLFVLDAMARFLERSLREHADARPHPPRHLLALLGPTGSGKTLAAAFVVAAWPEDSLVVSAEAADNLRGWDEVRPKAERCSLLVLDDLGNERQGATHYASDALRALLKARLDRSRVTILTSNLTREQVLVRYGGERLTSRFEQDGTVIPCRSGDLRRPGGAR